MTADMPTQKTNKRGGSSTMASPLGAYCIECRGPSAVLNRIEGVVRGGRILQTPIQQYSILLSASHHITTRLTKFPLSNPSPGFRSTPTLYHKVGRKRDVVMYLPGLLTLMVGLNSIHMSRCYRPLSTKISAVRPRVLEREEWLKEAQEHRER